MQTIGEILREYMKQMSATNPDLIPELLEKRSAKCQKTNKK